MLVLRRKAGEAIVLNGVITIHVLAVEGERVKLGISAPPEVVIVRSELLENQGPMPGGPASSSPYWSNPNRPRPPRERGGYGGEERRPFDPGGRPEQDGRDPGASGAGREYPRAQRPAPAPAPVYGGTYHEGEE
jgi:carbon storage regulator